MVENKGVSIFTVIVISLLVSVISSIATVNLTGNSISVSSVKGGTPVYTAAEIDTKINSLSWNITYLKSQSSASAIANLTKQMAYTTVLLNNTIDVISLLTQNNQRTVGNWSVLGNVTLFDTSNLSIFVNMTDAENRVIALGPWRMNASIVYFGGAALTTMVNINGELTPPLSKGRYAILKGGFILNCTNLYTYRPKDLAGFPGSETNRVEFTLRAK